MLSDKVGVTEKRSAYSLCFFCFAESFILYIKLRLLEEYCYFTLCYFLIFVV